MRFFASTLAASLVAMVAGAATGRAVEPVTTKETCRGMIKWSENGFFRSGSTVRYHGHMWQCTRWNKGENPESSDVWKDLGECDPDVQPQQVLSKRSALSARDDDDDDDEHPYCHGYLNWDPKAVFRSGTTVTYGGRLYQTSTWGSKAQPGASDDWKLIATCRTESKKAKRSQCDGVPDYDDRALYRSGTEVEYKSELFQSTGWARGVAPTDPHLWTHLGRCD